MWEKILGDSLNKYKTLLFWMVIGFTTGALIGVIAGAFGRSITIVTQFRNDNPWILYLMPLAGLLIVFIYHYDPYGSNTNSVIEGVQKGTYVPLRMAPFIIISTILTHAVGGSAGREGAALQLGGSLGGTIGRSLKLNEYNRKIMIMMGMSAAFSALFGTPLTATIFAMEVISVGIMYYAALVPCAFAAMSAQLFAGLVGAEGEHFILPGGIEFSLLNATFIIILAVLCGLLSMTFCKTIHLAEKYAKVWIKNPYLRVLAGSAIIILLTLALQSRDYLGAGMNIVEKAIEGETVPYAFIMKLIFTAVTLSCGFKGGEIVPTLFVGATFGCLFGNVIGFSPELCAACGMAAMFVGVTNTPLSTLFLCFELFGFEYMPFFLFSIAVGYLSSGYQGLYHSQKIMYSKRRLKFININAK